MVHGPLGRPDGRVHLRSCTRQCDPESGRSSDLNDLGNLRVSRHVLREFRLLLQRARYRTPLFQQFIDVGFIGERHAAFGKVKDIFA